MQYHISTGLIVKHFENKCDCPLCTIEKIVESNICRELLGDGCMDDDVRKQVNEKGFCNYHFDMLFEMPSKLGLALQCDTRMNTLFKTIAKPKKVKDAKKQAKKITEELANCIVCDFTEKEMIKYYKTIAQLWNKEQQFKDMLAQSNGFCIRHYANLLNFSEFAFPNSDKYLSVLYETEEKRLKYDQNLLKEFANRHDYRNLGKPLGEASSALKKIKSDFYGKK